MIDEQMKISTSIVDSIVPEIESKVKAKRSKKEVGKIGVCNDLSNFNHEETALDESKDIQKRTLEDIEAKKSEKKRRSKHENTLHVEKDKEMVKVGYEEKERNKETETKPPKKKKKKGKKENKEFIKIDGIYIEERKQNENTN